MRDGKELNQCNLGGDWIQKKGKSQAKTDFQMPGLGSKVDGATNY